MLANRVKETTTTTGTGNLTLAGAATNFQTFNNALGTNVRFTYWIVDDTNNVWETGVGYLSASTTLVRESVLDNSSGTTSALNLSAGTKDVFISNNGEKSLNCIHKIAEDLGSSHVAWVQSANMDGDGGLFNTTANRIYYHEFCLEVGGLFSGMANYVQSAGAAGTQMLMGLYQPDSLGQPGRLITDNNITIDTSSTGEKVTSFASNIYLAPGSYYAGTVVEDGNTSVRGVSRQTMSKTQLLSIQPTSGRALVAIDEAYTGGWTTPTLPATAGAGAYSFNTFEIVPTLYLVQA